MNDRELLELAAKAAGYDGLGSWDENAIWDGEGWHWNPLIDDGDALRLAVGLGIDVQQFVDSRMVEAWKYPHHACGKDYGADPYAATRRAIVRVAAQIGKQQEQPR